MGQRRERLKLEGGHLGPEDPGEAAVELAHARGAQLRPVAGGGAERGGVGGEVAGQAPQHLVHQERVGVVDDLLGVGGAAEPAVGLVVGRREPQELRRRHRHARAGARLERLERRLEPGAGSTQHPVDLAGQRPRRGEQPHLVGRRRVGRVVDEQRHPDAGVLLERRREERLADDPRLLAVGRHDDRERRVVPVERVVDHLPLRPAVGADLRDVAEPGDEVAAGGGGERGDDDQVDPRLGDRDHAVVGAVAADPLDEV
ncbi:MAG: hypothetical protein AB7U07_01660, partial [Thermoleophilia bacterium]